MIAVLLTLLGLASGLPQVVDHGSTWINLTWTLHCNLTNDDIINIRRYHIVLTDTTSGFYSYDINDFCTDTICTEHLENIRPCISYDILLEAEMNDGEKLKYPQQNLVMEEETPSKVRKTELTGTGNKMLNISWVPPEVGEFCVDHYKVCYRSILEDQEECIESVKEETSISKLTSCVEYEITVKPVTASGTEGDIATLTGVPKFSAPGPPKNLRAKASGFDYVSFFWTPDTKNVHCIRGVSTSCVESSDVGIYYQGQIESSFPSFQSEGEVFSEVTYLKECTAYDCMIKIPKEDGSIDSPSIQMLTTIVGIELSEPQHVQINSHKNAFDVFWMKPRVAARCVDGYYISWQSPNSNEGTVALDKNMLYHTIEGLQSCVTYSIRITAHTENWGKITNGSTTEVQARTLLVPPGPIENLVQDSAESNTITVCWNPPTQNTFCVHDYEVEIILAEVRQLIDLVAERRDDRICRTYQVQECSRKYKFCVTPVNEDGEPGPQSCTLVESSPCINL